MVLNPMGVGVYMSVYVSMYVSMCFCFCVEDSTEQEVKTNYLRKALTNAPDGQNWLFISKNII